MRAQQKSSASLVRPRRAHYGVRYPAATWSSRHDKIIKKYMQTKNNIEYRLGHGPLVVIPAGTEVEPANNLPQPNEFGIEFWVDPWDNMSPEAESWMRTYGFGVARDQVEKDEADWVFDNEVCPSSLTEDETTGKLRPIDESETDHKWDEDTDPISCAECGAEKDA